MKAIRKYFVIDEYDTRDEKTGIYYNAIGRTTISADSYESAFDLVMEENEYSKILSVIRIEDEARVH